MEKIKKMAGVVSRFGAIIILLILMLVNFLSILLAPLSKNFFEVPQIILIVHRLFDIFFGVIFIYCLYLLIKSNKNYLRISTYFLLAFYLFTTLYRFFFITQGHLETTDLNNLLFFLAPLALMFISYKLERPGIDKDTLVTNNFTSNVPFPSFQYQGFLVRGLANIIDQILVLFPFFAIISLTKIGSINSETNIAIGAILFFIYLIITESIWGQSLGKKLFRIKVVMEDGKKSTIIAAILRNLFRIVDVIFGGYLLALIVMTLTQKRQRVGDLIAKTVVVKQ